MISFELSQDQQHCREKARDFSENEIRPLSWKIDKGLTGKFHWSLLEKMAGQGLLFLSIPEEYGGSGLDFLTTSIVVEELAVGDGGIAFTATLNSYLPLLIAGTDTQKKDFLPLVCNRENPGLAAFALTEPNAGSDAGSLSTVARKEGQNYVLNGEKCFISNADMASLYVVLATVDKAKGLNGITAFLVPGDAEGLSRGKVENKLGFHSTHTGVFVLNDVRVDQGNRLGEEGDGFKIAMKYLDVLRVLSCGAVGVGVARAAFEAAVRFFKARPDAKKLMAQQAISFDLADMLASIEASRLMVWRSSWMLDNGLSASTMSSLTKFFVSDMAVEVANKALQLVGVNSYSEDYPLDKYARDAKVLQIYEGTNQICRLVASRGVFSG
ncbi:MAG: acyl-CoA dehydrogenase family protein [Deltaproteobacteria bacterium]|nr:acyl-CoA dehydrogenase family protein [Deltaproteobacteria bacterium]